MGTLLGACLLFLIWVWWLNAPGRLVVHSRELASILPVRGGGSIALDDHGRSSARCWQARSRVSERGILHLLNEHDGEPSRDRPRPSARQAETGRHDHSRGYSHRCVPRAWDGLGASHVLAMALLLAAVGFGAGGLAVGASVVSRRGRDAG